MAGWCEECGQSLCRCAMSVSGVARGAALGGPNPWPPACRECRFYRDKREGQQPIEGEGRCRRFPPVSDRSSHEARFPLVLATYWCGEYRPRG